MGVTLTTDKSNSDTNYREAFAQFLNSSERSPFTIKNYLCDLDAFGEWFRSQGNFEFEPAVITPTDLREYKQYLGVDIT